MKLIIFIPSLILLFATYIFWIGVPEQGYPIIDLLCIGLLLVCSALILIGGSWRMNSLSDNQQLNEGERANGNKNKRKRSWRNGF